jgi:hypothetical protein
MRHSRLLVGEELAASREDRASLSGGGVAVGPDRTVPVESDALGNVLGRVDDPPVPKRRQVSTVPIDLGQNVGGGVALHEFVPTARVSSASRRREA